MACGIPLISTDSGGLKQVIGDSALKIQSGSVKEIEEGLLTLFEDEGMRMKLALRGRRRMEEKFDWNIAAKNYADLFSKVIKQFKNADN